MAGSCTRSSDQEAAARQIFGEDPDDHKKNNVDPKPTSSIDHALTSCSRTSAPYRSLQSSSLKPFIQQSQFSQLDCLAAMFNRSDCQL
tara:strand:- start:1484 stop:1747 length:264 start_codon:yes stop_codon:yes gene_type:complete